MECPINFKGNLQLIRIERQLCSTERDKNCPVLLFQREYFDVKATLIINAPSNLIRNYVSSMISVTEEDYLQQTAIHFTAKIAHLQMAIIAATAQ